MDKKLKLSVIDEEIRRCRKCRIGKSGMAVPGEGNPDAEIIFLGEAPGREEAKCGRPFVGRSGKLLRSSITGIGLEEDEVFITSPVKYLPDRGTPTKEDIEHGCVHLAKQIEVIDPLIIVLLGSTACQSVLKEKVAVSSEHGTVIDKDGRKCFITFHPAAAIRFPKIKELFLEDFVLLRKVIQRMRRSH